jgi:PAS domain S-box-containing protein
MYKEDELKALSLHAFLTRLIWLCVGPLVLLAAYLSITNVLNRQAEGELEAANLAKSIAAMIDQHLHARISALHMLAESPLLDDASRWQDLYREAQGFHQGFGSHVILSDLNMRMLFNTRVTFGSELPLLPRPKGNAAVPTVLATGKPAVGDSFIGPIAKEPLVAIAVPATREDKITFLLLTLFETRHFQEHLERVALPPGWVLTLVDGKQEALARRPSPGLNAAMAVDPATRFVVKLELSPWSVILEIPHDVYRRPLIRVAFILTVALLAVTFISLLGGMWFSRRLARAVASIAENSPSAHSEPVIAEIEGVRTLLKDAAAARESSDKELRESEERYRNIFEAANVGKSVTFPSGQININRAFCEMLGYGPEELHSKTWQELTPAEEIGSVTDLLAPLLRGEKDRVRFEKRYIHKNGSHVWADVSVTLQRAGDGTPLYFITTVVDITERKQAEEALRQKARALRASNAELELFNRTVVNRELRMIEMKEEIDELCRRLGEPPRYRQ